MADRTLIIIGIFVGLVTVYAVVVAADGAVSKGEVEAVAAFTAGAGLAYIAMGGKKGPRA